MPFAGSVLAASRTRGRSRQSNFRAPSLATPRGPGSRRDTCSPGGWLPPPGRLPFQCVPRRVCRNFCFQLGSSGEGTPPPTPHRPAFAPGGLPLPESCHRGLPRVVSKLICARIKDADRLLRDRVRELPGRGPSRGGVSRELLASERAAAAAAERPHCASRRLDSEGHGWGTTR